MERKFEYWIYRAVALVLFVYVLLRAKFIPMTVDEVSTCISHVPRNILDILFYQKEAVPNNHVLNTLGIKTLKWFFGMYHLTARIPALIGAVLFLTAAIALANRSAQWWMRAFTFAILFCNPFMVEFFALARGYGLAVGIMLLAIWKAVAYLTDRKASDLGYASLLSVLAVEANFTLLNWFVPFVFFLGIAVYQKSDRPFLRAAWPVFGATALAGILCYLPITRMRATDQFQFWASSSFFKDTMVPLIKSSIHRHPYLGDQTVEILAWMIMAFSVAAWIIGLIRWQRNKGKLDVTILFSGIYAGTVVFNLLQNYLFKTPFLDARTSIFLYPLLALQCIAVAEWIYVKWSRWSLCFILPLGLFALANFNNNRNLKDATEWWFDKGTFELLDYLKATYEAEGRNEPFTIDSYWVNYNSLDFHINESTPHYDKYVRLTHWHPRRPYQSDTEFYYTQERDEIDAIINTYDIVVRIPDGPVLLRKKRVVDPPAQ